jgi:hypothetical protein
MRREILDRGLMDIQSRTAFNDWVHRVSSCGGSEELVWRDSARRAQRNNSGVPQAPTSYCERALPHQFVRDVGRTASVRIATLFMLRGDRKDMATVNNFARNTTDIT